MSNLSTLNLSLVRSNNIICKSLTISIKPGDKWGILGANGSGKTTLLHTLAGLLKPKAGSVLLDNNNIAGINTKTLAQRIGLLFQDTKMFLAQTVWEYCLTSRFPHRHYFKFNTHQDEKIIISALQLMDMITLKNRKITQLSGGEKRRLAITSLLIQSPQFYLLDEPNNHLDLRYQTLFFNHLQHLAELHAGIIMSLHDINLAERFCNKLLLLFPDGSTLQGLTHEVLNEINLQKLYHCNFTKVTNATQQFWLAE